MTIFTLDFYKDLYSKENNMEIAPVTGWRSYAPSTSTSSWGPSRRSSLTGLRSVQPMFSMDSEEAELDDNVFFGEESDSEVEKWSPKNFEKVEELGRGTFGTVFKCVCVDTGRHFVAKEMETNTHPSRAIAQSEVDLLKEIDHPRIIEYFGSVDEKDSVVLFIEYMSSSVLQMIKKCGPLAEKLALKFTRQTIEALAYIHSQGMVHNDVKCDNLLLDNYGNVKLSDFGSALQKSVDKGSPTFSPCDAHFGVSLYWSAPEVLNYEEFTCSADIWSLGCTIVEMLTTEPPFRNLDEEEFIASVEARNLSYDPEKLVPKASESMQLFLTFLLEENSGKRIQTGSAAEEKLDQIF